MTHNHHVSCRMFAERTVLKLLGKRFDMESPENIMKLPSDQRPANELGVSPHTGGHLGTYCSGFEEVLKALENDEACKLALNGDAAALDRLSADWSGFVAAAKYALANGHLLANTPAGMTRKEANEANAAWFANWRGYADRNRDQIQQMHETVSQLAKAGLFEQAKSWPILSPTSSLGLADRNDILARHGMNSPISLQFTAVGQTPGLKGLVPSVVDSRLPGFSSPSLSGLTQVEGFTPSNPFLTHGLPGFPAPDRSWQGLGRLPPSVAAPRNPLVLSFDPSSGSYQPFSGPSPILEPDPPSAAMPPTALYSAAGLAALAVAVPELLPLWARLAVTMAGTAAASAPAFASGVNASGRASGGVFSTGAAPYDAFDHSFAPIDSSGYDLGPASGTQPIEQKALAQPPEHADSFVDRFGNWDDTSAGAMTAATSGVLGTPASNSASAARPEDVRRLTRVNSSNSANPFVSGSPPVPYLLSPELDGRYGSMPPAAESPQASRPIGAFAEQSSYAFPPPIWKSEGPGGTQRNDAEEWYSRWIKPYLRQE